MKKHIRHVREHAKKHDEAHFSLKKLLSRELHDEKFWDAFISTFVIAIATIAIFLNWGNITSFFGAGEDEPMVATQEDVMLEIHGFQTGILATYQLNGQAADEYIRVIRHIPTDGFEQGIKTVEAVGQQQEQVEEAKQQAFLGSIFLSTDLSKGGHLTSLRDGARTLQKSILTTFYLGEKTVDINSTVQTDTKLLARMSNTLSVDIFAYLNQSDNRADTLDNYLNLLETLRDKAQARSMELTSQINFLSANFQAQEKSIKLSEDAFFENIKIFDGQNAETQLAQFIGLEQEQSEVRAKMGAYKGLKDYYDYFLPLINNLITAIRANRDPLIAGVKVVEIQNMTLPLIIRER